MPPITELPTQEDHAPVIEKTTVKKAVKAKPKLLAKHAERSSEAVLSKIPGQGKASAISLTQEKNATVEAKNQTAASAPLAPTHGPIAVYSPSPILPDYLKDEAIKTNVVMEFFITATGETTVQLMSSSGNEELDALAIATGEKWRFQPAEENHTPINSKIRLRIVFEVK